MGNILYKYENLFLIAVGFVRTDVVKWYRTIGVALPRSAVKCRK
jgi:hypothetical protein